MITADFKPNALSRLISNLIKSIARILQKLLRYFKVTIILTFLCNFRLFDLFYSTLKLNDLVVVSPALKSTMLLSLLTVGTSL